MRAVSRKLSKAGLQNPNSYQEADDRVEALQGVDGEVDVIEVAADAHSRVDFAGLLTRPHEEERCDRRLDKEQEQYACADQLNEEEIVVADAYTVVYPGAVVIPALDTLVTNAAMVRTWRREHLTARADIIWVEILQQVHQIVFFPQISRVFATGHDKAKRQQYPEHCVQKCHDVRIKCAWRF